MNTTAKRTVTTLTRYHIKKGGVFNGVTYAAGTIVLSVENDKGQRYYVTLRRSGAHSCTCPHVPSKKSPTCYHINDCRQVENTRAASERQAKETAARLAREVEAICAEAEHEAPAAPPAREIAPLNGNRAFSLLRK